MEEGVVVGGVVGVWCNGVASVATGVPTEVSDGATVVGVWCNGVASVATRVPTEVSDGATNRGSFIEVDHDVQ